MTFKLLFVCSANVCRSPTAAALLSRRLLAAGRLRDVLVASAGTDAVPRQPWCPIDARHVDLVEPELAKLRSWTSCKATPGRIRHADLILCADRRVLNQVVRSSPENRSGAFTILEAAALVRAVTSSQWRAEADDMIDGIQPVPEEGSPEVRLAWLVNEMDAARGQFPMPPRPRRAWPLRRSASDPTEIADIHHHGERAHRALLKQLGQATDALAQGIVATLSADAGVAAVGEGVD